MSTTTVKRPAPQPASARLFFRTYRFQISIISLLVVLYAVFIIRAPGTYLSFAIYRSFMISIPFFGLMAMAATFIVTLGEIDLSFPSIAGFSGWVFAASYVGTDSFIIALVLCLGTGALLGLINGLLVTKVRIPSIVATIGTMFLWSGLVNVVTEGHGIPISRSPPIRSIRSLSARCSAESRRSSSGSSAAQFLWAWPTSAIASAATYCSSATMPPALA